MIKESIFLRNICADLVSDFVGYPDAGQLNRLFRILEMFDKDLIDAATDSPIISKNYAMVLRAASEHAAHIINSSYKPTKLQPAKKTDETLAEADNTSTEMGKAFDETSGDANSTQDGNGKENQNSNSELPGLGNDRDTNDNRDKIPQELVELALEKIKIVYKPAHDMLLGEDDVNTAMIYATTMGAYFRSACWQSRTNKEKGGCVLSKNDGGSGPPRKFEIKIRKELKSSMLNDLKPSENNKLHISIYCKLLSDLQYAEWRYPPDGLDDEAEQKFTDKQFAAMLPKYNSAVPHLETTLTKESSLELEILVPTLRFTGNLIISLIRRDDKAQASSLFEITCAILEIGEKASVDDYQVLQKFIEELLRVAVYSNDENFIEEIGQENWTAFLENVDKYIQKHAVFSDLDDVDDFCFHLYINLQKLTKKTMLPKITHLISKSGRYNIAFKTLRKNNLAYYFSQLLLRGDAAASDVKIFLDALISGIGGKARHALVSVLMPVWFNPTLKVDAANEIIHHLQSDIDHNGLGKQGLGKNSNGGDMPDDSRAQALCVLWAHLLLGGANKTVAVAIGKYWRMENSENHIRARTLALRGLALLGSFCPTDKNTRPFYEKLQSQDSLGAIKNTLLSELVMGPMALQTLITNHDDALANAISTLAQKDIAAGNDPLPWVNHTFGGPNG